MTSGARLVLYWAPRLLAMLFAAFLSLFALDVFDAGGGVGHTVAALLIHLIPTYVVVIGLIAAWRHEWLGAVLFTGMAVLYVAWTWGRFPLATYLTLAGPLVAIGVLFLINWIKRSELRPAEPSPPGGDAPG